MPRQMPHSRMSPQETLSAAATLVFICGEPARGTRADAGVAEPVCGANRRRLDEPMGRSEQGRPNPRFVTNNCGYRKLDPHEGMVQATEVSERPDLALTCHRSSSGRIFSQGAVRAQSVGVVCILGEDPPQVALVEYEYVVEELPTDGSNRTFDIFDLPGKASGGRALPNAYRSEGLFEYLAIGGVTDTRRYVMVRPNGSIIGTCRHEEMTAGYVEWMVGVFSTVSR